MRTLTVTRRKSSAARFKRVTLYIEDNETPEQIILNVPCRRLGDLMNGEMNMFDIPEAETQLIAVVDAGGQANKYSIPAGNGQVVLSGSCAGSSPTFCFGYVPKERKAGRGVKIALLALLPAVLLVTFLTVIAAITGVLPHILERESPRNYSGEGYVITLTDQFYPMQIQDCVGAYNSEDSSVFIYKIDFAQAPLLLETMTVQEYAMEFRESFAQFDTSLKLTDIRAAGALTYFDIIPPEGTDGDEYRSRLYVYKGSDAFWSVEVAVPLDSFEKKEKKMNKWAESFRILEKTDAP